MLYMCIYIYIYIYIYTHIGSGLRLVCPKQLCVGRGGLLSPTETELQQEIIKKSLTIGMLFHPRSTSEHQPRRRSVLEAVACPREVFGPVKKQPARQAASAVAMFARLEHAR